MKQRLKKKLLKKAQAAGQMQLAQPVELTDAAKLFALECWRIKKLLPGLSDNKKYLVLTSSVDKLFEALENSGIEIEDPEGLPFRDGMTLDVALFADTPQLSEGTKVVTETLAPTIYVKNKLVQPARVIVSVGTGRE
jgi:hypothetical protein